ncbi:MAG TPA: 50S ribosomal protein L32 [Candidatus Paceibacterota bacterium]|nr:50S ribosomal protein L32 [Candidatus Paceibacterota bacterium]
MVVRMRHTRAHTRNRRSHHALKAAFLSTCANCSAKNMPHTVCKTCGYYRGRKVLEISPVGKKEKGKEKEKKSAKTTK